MSFVFLVIETNLSGISAILHFSFLLLVVHVHEQEVRQKRRKCLGVRPLCSHSCWIYKLAEAFVIKYVAFTTVIVIVLSSLFLPHFQGCSRDSRDGCPCHKSREEIGQDKSQASGEIWALVSVS